MAELNDDDTKRAEEAANKAEEAARRAEAAAEELRKHLEVRDAGRGGEGEGGGPITRD